MTFYAKLKEDGSLDRYPYTLTDLRRDNRQTSFPDVITDEIAASFGAVPVQPCDPPADDPEVNVERSAVKQAGKWVEVWTSTPASAEQIAERAAAKSNDVRNQRNELLAKSDWTQLGDVLDGDPLKDLWAEYRQALRDISEQPGFPWEVSWPSEP